MGRGFLQKKRWELGVLEGVREIGLDGCFGFS